MSTFKKRVFTPWELVKRLGLAVGHLPFLLRGILAPRTSRQLRERVMLAVTSVNDCRYCAWLHTRLALSAGLTIDEVNGILQRTEPQEDSSADGAAILFARHYAETRGAIERSASHALQHHFSASQIREIMSYIHAIYAGNLFGNTFDALLTRIRGGKVEGSSVLFEVVCSIFSAPVLGLILLSASRDKEVKMAPLQENAG